MQTNHSPFEPLDALRRQPSIHSDCPLLIFSRPISWPTCLLLMSLVFLIVHMTEKWRLHGKTDAISLATVFKDSSSHSFDVLIHPTRPNHIAFALDLVSRSSKSHLLCTIRTDKNRFPHMQDYRVHVHIHTSTTYRPHEQHLSLLIQAGPLLPLRPSTSLSSRGISQRQLV